MTGHAPSIILVVYNGMRYLPGCLASLAGECLAYPGSEVIVVDNASSDGSTEWIASYYPEIRLLRQEENLGFAAGNNRGAVAAQGDVLVFLNQDTRVLPGWLKALVNGLYQSDDVGLTTSRLLYMHQPERINLCGQDILYTGMTFGRGTLRAADALPEARQVSAVAGASFAIRKELWQQLGGFDEGFFMYYEETDLSWRASLLGYQSWYIPGSAALHDANVKPSVRATYYSMRNRPRLLLKHWKWQTLVLILPALLLTEVLDWVYLMRLGPSHIANKLKASAWLLLNLGQIIKSRRQAQALRKVTDASLIKACTYTLTPSSLPASGIGKGFVHLANFLLGLNHHLAVRLLEWMKI